MGFRLRKPVDTGTPSTSKKPKGGQTTISSPDVTDAIKKSDEAVKAAQKVTTPKKEVTRGRSCGCWG